MIKSQNISHKPNKFKQLLKTLQNLQHLCSLEKHLNNLLCDSSNHYNMRKNVQKKKQICIVLCR